MYKTIRISFALLLFFLCLTSGFAQFEAGSVLGVVKDSTGAVIAGASVELRSVSTNAAREGVSNSTGEWNFVAVQPGPYMVTIKQTGLRDEIRKFNVSVGQKLQLDVTMSVGAAESVTVNASGELMETVSSEISNVRTTQQVQDLPLNSRNFTQLVQLAPGVNNKGTGTNATNGGYTEGRGTSGAVVNGNPSDMTVYLYDGIQSVDADANVLIFSLPVDAIQEFKVQSSAAAAAYGQGPSIISVATRSGTNELHGTVYEFLRNAMFDAKNYFDSRTAPIPPFHLNQFGANLSGPIMIPHLLDGRNKLFFFIDYEGKRQAQSQTVISTVPTPAFRIGNFAALPTQLKNPSTGAPLVNNQVTSISPTSANIMALFPLPNTGPANAISNNFLYNGRLLNNIDQGDIKIDFRTPKTSIFGRYSEEQAITDNPGALPSPAIGGGPGYPGITAAPGKQVVLGLGRSFGNDTYYEARLGYSRLLESIVTQGAMLGNISEQLGIANANAGGVAGFTNITISGNASIGSPSNVQKVNNLWEVNQALTLTRGKHEIKIGGNFMSTRFAFYTPSSANGAMSFTGAYTGYMLCVLLYGHPATTTLTVTKFFSLLRFRPSFYIQDSYRATSKLTLNFGLRDELVTPWKERANRLAGWDPSNGGNLVPVGSGSGPFPGDSVTAGRYTNFGPRIGFAYQIDPKTTVRGGFGIFYGYENANSNPMSKNAPFNGSLAVSNDTSSVAGYNASTTISQGFPAARPDLFPVQGSSFSAYTWASPNPTANEYNLNVERQISSHDVLTVAYVGQTGTHIISQLNINQPTPGAGAVATRRPFPNFSDGTLYCYCATSSFNSLQVTYQNHIRNGLDFQGVYTWSHSIDTSSSAANSTNAQKPDIGSNRGNSDFDERHMAVFSLSYRLPFGRGQQFANQVGTLTNAFIGGWQINNIDTLSSGSPFTPVMGTSQLNAGSAVQRPNRIGSGKLAHPTISQWFNTADFAPPGLYTYGNSGRNILAGPGTALSDLSLFKEFKFNDSGSRYLQLRAEAFNVLNRPQFNNPNASIGTPAAGTVTSAGAASLFSRSSRQIQLAAKLYF